MRYWLDTEFWERPTSIDLISIGLVAEDQREFYAVNKAMDLRGISCYSDDWLWENVLPHLPPMSDDAWKYPAEIRNGLLGFCHPGRYGKPEFWGYYADYDWVVFCWLFGAMVDLPLEWPMYCRDIKQWADSLGNPPLPKQAEGEHDALADARHHKAMWEFLRDYETANGEE